MKGARRASICSWMSGDIGVDAVDAAEHVRAQEWVLVGEMPAKRSAQLVLLLLTWTGVDSSYGSTADQGRTGRKDSSSRLWRLARALGTHAKQGPSTGHSAVGLRQAGKLCPGRRGHLSPRHHARLVTRLLVLRTALLFVRSAVRLVYANSRSRSSSPKQALLRAGTANIPSCRTLARRTGLFRARYRGRAPGCGHLSAHRNFDHARRARAKP